MPKQLEHLLKYQFVLTPRDTYYLISNNCSLDVDAEFTVFRGILFKNQKLKVAVILNCGKKCYDFEGKIELIVIGASSLFKCVYFGAN